MMSKTNYSLRLGMDVNSEELDAAAEKLNCSRNAFINKAVKFFMSFDPDFLEALDVWSKQLGVPQKIFTQNLILDWIAGATASVEIFGAKEMQLPEFPVVGNELVTGSKFYEYRKKQYLTIFEQEKAFNTAAVSESEKVK